MTSSSCTFRILIKAFWLSFTSGVFQWVSEDAILYIIWMSLTVNTTLALFHLKELVLGSQQCMDQGYILHGKSGHQGSIQHLVWSYNVGEVQKCVWDMLGTTDKQSIDILAAFFLILELVDVLRWLLMKCRKINLNIPFGIERKATGRTEFPCPQRAVFVRFPGEMYTGWYSWWLVATETVVLSLPAITGTSIDPCVTLSAAIAF